MPHELSTRLALDTNVLLDLAKGIAEVKRFFELSKRKRRSLTVSPTVLDELDYTSRDERDAPRKKLANAVLDKLLLEWDIIPMPEHWKLEEVSNFSTLLRTRHLLPMSEKNDGRILAECSLEGVGILITSDRHLLSPQMDPDGLTLAFQDAGMKVRVVVLTPTHMANILRRMA